MLALAIIALFFVTAFLVAYTLADSAVRARNAYRRVRFERRSLAQIGSGVEITDLTPKASVNTPAPGSVRLTVVAGSKRRVRQVPELAAAA